tara:strand:- start:286 stop:1188 length:903 start_codon:yes stop_codon:yes gene_type:complete
MPQKNNFFFKKEEFLSQSELRIVSKAFFKSGIKKIRITGGEPLIRKDIVEYLSFLSDQKKRGILEEILISTNGTQLKKYSKKLFDLGIKRINVSIDSLVSEKYNFITNGGNLEQVLNGIYEAKKCGLEIKINTVLLKNFNEDEILRMVEWCANNKFKQSFIEVMPVGELSTNRENQYLPVSFAKKLIRRKLGLIESKLKTNGPSRYFRTDKFKNTIGFISPISEHFCATCNRIRVTSNGILYPCLGDNSAVDLKPFISNKNQLELFRVIKQVILRKPEKHFFKINEKGYIKERFMNTTGG